MVTILRPLTIRPHRSWWAYWRAISLPLGSDGSLARYASAHSHASRRNPVLRQAAIRPRSCRRTGGALVDRQAAIEAVVPAAPHTLTIKRQETAIVHLLNCGPDIAEHDSALGFPHPSVAVDGPHWSAARNPSSSRTFIGLAPELSDCRRRPRHGGQASWVPPLNTARTRRRSLGCVRR